MKNWGAAGASGGRGSNRGLLIGAAIGLGMTARAAAQGGADFLLALNAGRLRVMGAASNAAMLPLNDSNRFTHEFASREIVGRVAVPVLFGACVFDAELDLDRLLEEIKAAGYAGVVNFPTAIHFDGPFRDALESAGLGFGREVEMLTRARTIGLRTLGYAKTRTEAQKLVEAGVERLCLNFGWNAGGTLGIAGGTSLDVAADRARRLFAMARRLSPGVECFVEGGPIVLPLDALKVCDASRADGYIGGSTLDRLPLEMSVMQTTSAFKTAPLLREAQEGEAREHLRISALAGLIGQSEAMAELAERIARLVATDLSILIAGPAGAGKTTAARAVHLASRRSGAFRVLDASDPSLSSLLFGAVEPGALDGVDATVVVENIEAMQPSLQARLVDWIEQALAERFLRGSDRRHRARLVLTLSTPVADEASIKLASALAATRLDVPALTERLEDVPLLARTMLATFRRQPGTRPAQVAPDAMRMLLAHDWPGNVRELSQLLARAHTQAQDGIIQADLVRSLLAGATARTPPAGASERDWILDALRRHRFRRGATAAFLGVSRKTLYNKMQRYELTD